VLAYRDMGYLPEAVVNYLVRLGWSHGDQELFTRQELIEKFDFKHVQSSSAVFNPEKMLWVNEQYLKQGEPGHGARLLIPFLEQAGLKKEAGAASPDWLAKLVVMVRERTKTLAEMVTWATPYFGQDVAMDGEAAKKFLTPAVAPALAKLAARFEAEPAFHKEQWEAIFKQVVEEQGMKMGQLAQPVRVALTGRTASPGLFEVMELLGRERTLARLKKGIERAKTPA
jgi:glutamyl-tRNA synthetase